MKFFLKDLVSTKLDHAEELFFAGLLGFGDATLLDHKSVELKLFGGPIDNALLDGIFRHETEDLDGLFLTDTVSTVLSLEIHLRIPITVVENDNIGGGKVDTETTSSGRKHEDELIGVLLVVGRDLGIAEVTIGTTVDATVIVLLHVAVVFEEVQNASHLREDEDTGALLLEPHKKLVEEHHLTGVLNDVRAIGVWWTWLGTVKEVRVVGALAELHHDILEAGLGGTDTVHSIDIALEQLLVVVSLHLRHATVKMSLLLWWEILLDISLHATKHEWADNGMERLHDGLLTTFTVQVEELIKVVGRCELLWQKEVEERPELVKIVLCDGARELAKVQERRVRKNCIT